MCGSTTRKGELLLFFRFFIAPKASAERLVFLAKWVTVMEFGWWLWLYEHTEVPNIGDPFWQSKVMWSYINICILYIHSCDFISSWNQFAGNMHLQKWTPFIICWQTRNWYCEENLGRMTTLELCSSHFVHRMFHTHTYHISYLNCPLSPAWYHKSFNHHFSKTLPRTTILDTRLHIYLSRSVRIYQHDGNHWSLRT